MLRLQVRLRGASQVQAGPFVQKLDADLVIVILDLAYITAVRLSTCRLIRPNHNHPCLFVNF